MHTKNQQKPGRDQVLELLTNIAGLVFETENPLFHALEIVRQTALSCDADISTLFVVEEQTRLELKAGVAYLRDKEMELPKIHSYELDWNATKESDMKGRGLTAFVASSGQSLSVESYDELMDKNKHPAHTGRWDKDIYPDGVDDTRTTGFGCFYAVPLRRSKKGSPKDTVIGVFKIERRRNRPKFNDEDHRVFDLVAAHLSLILQTLYRVQNRVFSDVAHAIGGGLGRSYMTLTTCEHILKQEQGNLYDKLNFIERHLPGAVRAMEKACKRLNMVLDASRDPDRITEESVGKLWDSIIAEVELKAHLTLDDSKVTLDLKDPVNSDTKFRIRSIQYYDLSSILGNLLDNSIRHGQSDEPVKVSIMPGGNMGDTQLVFRVADRGQGIPMDVIESVKDTAYTEMFRLPGTGSVQGTGLRRVFGLANHNNWKILYRIDNGTEFEIRTPDFRRVPEQKGKIS